MRRAFLTLLLLIPALYLLLFFFYPLFEIMRVSLFPGGEWDASGVVALVGRARYRQIIGFTFWQAALSTLGTLLVGFPVAYAFARFHFPGKRLLRALLTVPFVLPTVVVSMAFLALLGPRGLINGWLQEWFNLPTPPIHLQDSLALILLAHIFYNLAVVIRIVGGFWASMDPHLSEAAATLGASPLRALYEVTLPLLFPALGAAALLVFLFTFSSFGVVLLLGGPRLATLEVEVYRQAVTFFNLPVAALLSLLQIGFTFAAMSLYTRLQERTTVPLTLRSAQSAARAPRGWCQKFFVVLVVGLPTLFVLAPLGALVQRSLMVGSGGPTLEHFRALAEPEARSVVAYTPLVAVRNSLGFALATTGLSLVLGTLCAYALAPPGRAARTRWQRVLDPLVLLPLGTSAVTLGFGFLVALDAPPLNLRTSALLVPLAHSLIAFPLVMRTLLPSLRSIQPALREAAMVLGARPVQVLREVDLPIVARALVVGAVFAFGISLGEFGATALIRRPEWPTMPVVIFDYLAKPGSAHYGRALAMSVVLMSTPLISFFLIERVRLGDGEEF